MKVVKLKILKCKMDLVFMVQLITSSYLKQYYRIVWDLLHYLNKKERTLRVLQKPRYGLLAHEQLKNIHNLTR